MAGEVENMLASLQEMERLLHIHRGTGEGVDIHKLESPGASADRGNSSRPVYSRSAIQHVEILSEMKVFLGSASHLCSLRQPLNGYCSD